MIVIQCDEHVPRSVQEGLQAKGIDARRVETEKLKGISDIELLSFCLKNNRVLLTNDADFVVLAKRERHLGIIFITDQRAPVGEIIRAVLYLCYAVENSGFRNSLFYVP
jgi:predicted nuclease of predicted toxin-antitoxin system